MKNFLSLLIAATLLTGCVESMALLGPVTGAGTGKMTQSAASSAVSFGVKKATGKTPGGHALAYAKKHNPENKKENCVGLKSTNSKACAIANKKVAYAKSKVKETLDNKKISFKKQFAKARKSGRDFFVYNNKIYNTSFKKTDDSKKKLSFFNR